MRTFFYVTTYLIVVSAVHAQLTLPGGYTPLTPERRLRAANVAGNYIVSGLQEDGKFTYEIGIKSGLSSERYVWGDHALAVMTLARLFEYGGDKAYLKAAEKAAKPMVAKIEDVTVGSAKHSAFVDTGMIEGVLRKLVRTTDCAMVAVALAELDRVRKTTTHQGTVKKLCLYLQSSLGETGIVKPLLLVGDGISKTRFLELHSKAVQSKVLFALATVDAAIPMDSTKATIHKLLHSVAYQWQTAVEAPRTKPFDNWGVIGVIRFLARVDDEMVKTLFEGYSKHVADTATAIEKELKSDITQRRRKVLSNLMISTEALRQVVKRGGPMTKAALEKLLINYCQTELLSLIRKDADLNKGTFDTRLRTVGRILPTAYRVEGISAVATHVMRTPESPAVKKIKGWVPDVDLSRKYLLARQITPALAKQYNTELSVAGAFAIHSVCIMPCCHAINAFLGW